MNGALLAGGTTFLGGILFGPVGFVIGATIGGTAAYYLHRGKFKPLSTVLKELPQEDWDKIIRHLKNTIVNFDDQNLNDVNIQNIVLRSITKELKMPIVE